MVHPFNFSFLHAKLGYSWLYLSHWTGIRVNGYYLQSSWSWVWHTVTPPSILDATTSGPWGYDGFKFLSQNFNIPQWAAKLVYDLKRNGLWWKLYRYNLKITRGSWHKGTNAWLHSIRYLDSANPHSLKADGVTDTGGGGLSNEELVFKGYRSCLWAYEKILEMDDGAYKNTN